MTALKSLTFSVCLALPALACGQMQSIEYSRVFSVRNLKGVAVDPSGATVADVKVEICKDNWTDCFASATTGADGKLSFSSVPHESVRYVKVSARGFDVLRLRVRQRFLARKGLVVKMHIAT
jgi:hypothetical protein